MRKLALGKGLRALLHGTPLPGRSNAAPSAAPQAHRSPGVGTLLRGSRKTVPPHQNGAIAPPAAVNSPQWRHWVLVRWIVLIAADVLLLAMASVLVFKHSGRLGFGEWLLCVASFGAGAALALLALLGDPRTHQSSSGSAEPSVEDDRSVAQ